FDKNHIAPELLSAPNPHSSEKAFQTWHVYRRLGGVGLLPAQSGDAWLQIHGVKSRERQEILGCLAERYEVREIVIDRITKPYFIRTADLPILDEVQNRVAAKASIIAPLDNLLWDRKMIRALFNFDYVWEVYKPVGKRRFGYYVLPVLYGDRFIARFEPGRNRETGNIIIKNWWWEDDVKTSNGMQKAIKSCFIRFRKIIGANGIESTSEIEDRIGINLSA
ncbi:MAG: hypothetical protein HN368_08115, partial [Spirochaetales bacterium]|nr:hypothetical protein [Spirochaetales bacterium]